MIQFFCYMEATESALPNQSHKEKSVSHNQKMKDNILTSKESLEDLSPVLEYYDQLINTPEPNIDVNLLIRLPRNGVDILRSEKAWEIGEVIWNKFSKPNTEVDPKKKNLAGLFLVTLALAQNFSDKDKENFSKSRILPSHIGENFMETAQYYQNNFAIHEIYPHMDNKEEMERREGLIQEMEVQVWNEFKKPAGQNSSPQ